MANHNQTDKIKCPECNALFPITKTLWHQLAKSASKKYEEKLDKQMHELEDM